MNRREALKRAVLLLGGALSTSTLAAINRWESRDMPAGGLNLTAAQRQILAAVAEMILPETDTPGAKTTGVPAFVEMMVNDCYRAPEQNNLVEGLTNLEKANFLNQNSAERTATLRKLEADTIAGRPHAVAPFWTLMKDLTLLGYFTSEAGIKASYVYEPIPGKLENIKIKPDQKAFVY